MIKPLVVVCSIVLFLFIGAVGCSTTGVVVQEVNQPLNFIRHAAVKHLPGGLTRTSENGRELFSGYFPPRGKIEEDASNQKERAYAQVLVLGDRRPYKVEVRVHREVRRGKSYVNVGLDRKIAEDLAQRIRSELANRREDINIIDDFRPF